jgi:hypothetical protein
MAFVKCLADVDDTGVVFFQN